jgi:hypothetical protein
MNQDGLRALIEYIERVVDDLLTLPAFMTLVNTNQKHVATFVLILVATYKEEKARRLKKEAKH